MQLIGKVIGEVIYLAYLKVSFVWQMIPSSSSHFNQPKDCDFCFLPFFRNSFFTIFKVHCLQLVFGDRFHYSERVNWQGESPAVGCESPWARTGQQSKQPPWALPQLSNQPSCSIWMEFQKCFMILQMSYIGEMQIAGREVSHALPLRRSSDACIIISLLNWVFPHLIFFKWDFFILITHWRASESKWQGYPHSLAVEHKSIIYALSVYKHPGRCAAQYKMMHRLCSMGHQ